MFPWSPEFAWDVPHLVFFGALYSVVATIAATLAVAAVRSLRDARQGRTEAVAWHADFEDLPASARACRHQLTGEAPGRVCERAFDCRGCGRHGEFEAARHARPVEAPRGFAFDVPLDRLYHRGHTWARPEKDGLVTVGVDEVGARVLGPGAEIELPAPGTRVHANAPLARVRARGREARLLSPVDGTVVEVRPDGARFTLRVDPGPLPDLRHLLYADEARLWALRELERLQAACGGPAGAALADGGELVEDVGAAVPEGRYDALLGDLFLEP
jgi:glycine cleavage system H protein